MAKAKEKEDAHLIKPYLQYSCQGRYMEPGMPWSLPGSGCGQTCDLRLLCWAQRNGVTVDTAARD